MGGDCLHCDIATIRAFPRRAQKVVHTAAKSNNVRKQPKEVYEWCAPRLDVVAEKNPRGLEVYCYCEVVGSCNDTGAGGNTPKQSIGEKGGWTLQGRCKCDAGG